MQQENKTQELRPIKESTRDYEAIEKRIKAAFRELLYDPLIRQLSLSVETIQNDRGALFRAVSSGKITFDKGVFIGKFDATTSKELRALGAIWDRKLSGYRILAKELPAEIAHAIASSEAQFLKKLERLDEQLRQKLPEEIAMRVQVSDLFDSTLWRVDRELKKTLKGITIAPDLTPHMAKRIASEWQENMDKWIKDFTEEEITSLRKDVQKAAFSGNRRESIIGAIKRSYGVTERKAKFLARQETSLLMTKFKESRYTDAGIHEYKWRCVAGSKLHPVRPSHKILDGKVFRWDTPPITTAPSEPVRRNNPGEDYNCRCAAIPIIRRQV